MCMAKKKKGGGKKGKTKTERNILEEREAAAWVGTWRWD